MPHIIFQSSLGLPRSISRPVSRDPNFNPPLHFRARFLLGERFVFPPSRALPTLIVSLFKERNFWARCVQCPSQSFYAGPVRCGFYSPSHYSKILRQEVSKRRKLLSPHPSLSWYCRLSLLSDLRRRFESSLSLVQFLLQL